MSEDQHLSRLLYQALDQVGACEHMRKFHKQSATSIEIIFQIYQYLQDDKNISFHIVGSRYEGSVTPSLVSDHDIISCLNGSVVLDPASIPHGLSCLMIKDEWTYPGYVKLQWVVHGHPLNYSEWMRPDDTLNDVIGRHCNKHKKIPGIRMQGPAVIEIDKYGKHFMDNVFALRCDSIPYYAKTWITRQRSHNWPTTEQLETMSKMGCMVVAVGHWKSCERDIEWRLSFSLQERVLMSSLNPVQHKVYVVLKMIKKDILGKTIQGESLSSYHCKTCILYAVERTPANFWIPDNLINCVLYCLRLLLWWTEDGFCPNYFIEEHNLFAKESFLRVKYQLRNELKRLIEMKHNISYLLETDCISNIMRNEDMAIILFLIDDNRKTYMIDLKIQVIKFQEYVIAFDNYKNIPYILYELQTTDGIDGYSKHETQAVVNYIQPWLHLYIAKYLTAQSIVIEDKHSADKLLRRADEHFCCTFRTDVTSVRFAKASILYLNGKYENCRRLLLEIERDLTDQVVNMCGCKGEFILNYMNINAFYMYALKKKLSQLSVASISQHHIASCVVFTRSESRITPTALQYEMYRSLDTEPGSRNEEIEQWFDCAVVDARVYLYFLQYLVYEALCDDLNKQLALDNLETEIEKCHDNYTRTGESRLNHKETAYNLLTWIYLRKKHDAKAIRCFTESLKIRPDHNAAKFLIRDMNLL